MLILIYEMVRRYRANDEGVEYLQTTKQCIPKIGITALLFVIFANTLLSKLKSTLTDLITSKVSKKSSHHKHISLQLFLKILQ